MTLRRRAPRIIIFDIETLPNLKEVMRVFPSLSDYWGQTLKASINSIICFGYKVVDEDKKAKCVNAWDFPSWNKDVNDDYEIVKALRKILNEADAVVTHNGKRFDFKFIQSRLLYHNLPLLHDIKHIDTCTLAKKNLFLFNNKLNTLGKFILDEGKLENGGWDLWCRVMERDPKAMKLMSDYCKQDVNLLEKVFLRVRPFAKNIPNHNLFLSSEDGSNLCNSCGSVNLQKNGIRTTLSSISQRYRCLDCGSCCAVKIDQRSVNA